MSLLPILMWYQANMSLRFDDPVFMKDYVVVVSLYHGLDAQIMKNIVKCESQFRQFKADGTHLISLTSDVGLMQINQVHWKRAKSLGLDIFNSPIDNMEMAKIIQKEQGYTAWSCYNRKVSDGT